ncbi:MAG TPA: DUF4397 domain-containing protein [Chryseosolibacter sp.]
MRVDLMKFILRFRSIFYSMALIVLLFSCMDDDDNVSEPVEVAYVSIYHAAPDAPEFDIVVDGRVINRNPFDYTSYSGYLNFLTGSREIKFNTVNANSSLIDTTFSLENGKAYSMFAIDRMPDVEVLFVVDSAGTPEPGKSMVRFVNLSPDAPAFDVSVAGVETPLFTAKSFRQATNFVEVDADTYTFEIKNAGGSDASLTAEDVEILPGRYYTIISRGFVTPPQGNNNVLSVEVLD